MYTTPGNIEDSFETAKEDPSKDYHLESELNSVYRWINEAENHSQSPQENIKKAVQDTEISFPGLIAAECLCQWYTDQSYKDALAGIYLLSEGYEMSRERGWETVAIFCLQKLITLQKELGYDYDSEVIRIVQFIEQAFKGQEDVHMTNLGTLFELISDNSDDIHRSILLRTLVFCIMRVNLLRDQGSYLNKREFLKTAINIGNSADINVHGLERRYAETYHLRGEYQDNSLSEGSEFELGLNDEIVQRALTDEEKRQWKEDMSDAFEKGAQELKRTGVDLRSRVEYNPENDWEKISNIYQLIARRYSRTTAFYWFLTSSEFVPDWNWGLEGATIGNAFSTLAPSSGGHVTRIDPNIDPEDVDSEDEVKPMYLSNLSHYYELAVNSFTYLLNEGQLSEGRIYVILNEIPWLTNDDRWYLTKVTTAIFDRRFAEAIHMGVPRLESILYQVMKYQGEDVDSLLESGSGTRTLSPLLETAEDYIGEDFYRYLKYTYADQQGEIANGNIRNRVSHGHFTYYDDNGLYAFLLLFDILRIGIRCAPTSFIATFGLPSKFSLIRTDAATEQNGR